jgi:hypothetical protein
VAGGLLARLLAGCQRGASAAPQSPTVASKGLRMSLADDAAGLVDRDELVALALRVAILIQVTRRLG